MFPIPQLTTLKKKLAKLVMTAELRLSRFMLDARGKRWVIAGNVALFAAVGFFAPSEHAYALPLLVPFLWVAGGALVAKIGGGYILDKVGGALMEALIAVSQLIFTIAGYFMMAMAGILDMAIMFTINSDIYKAVSAIQVGWTAVRDLSNMFFIFVLLYIAILTILGMGGSNAKRWVAHLIIAALLINFSLFITQVVVDAGNVLAVGFWNKMVVQAGPNASSSAAAFFLEGFRIQTTFDTQNNAAGNTVNVTQAQKLQIFLGAAVVQFVAGYVFLAGAIMMIIRSVTLMVLMIASPFAFLGFALPKGGGFASQWLDKLIGATFMAPAFVFMLYIDSLIIRGAELIQSTGSQDDKWALALSGQVGNFAIIYNFLLMIILLLAALTVAQKVSGGVGSSAGGWAKKTLGVGGGLAAAGVAIGGRRVIGGAADKLRSNEKIQKAAQATGLRGAMARATIRTSNATAKASFDMRGAPGMKSLSGVTGVSFGAAGGAGGYQALRQKKDKEIISKAEELFPGNPAAQEAYIRNATRTIPTSKEELKSFGEKGILYGGLPSRMEQKPSQFARKEDKILQDKQDALAKEKKKKDAEQHLEGQPGEHDALTSRVNTLEADRKALQDKKDNGTATAAELTKLTQTEADLTKANKDLKDSLDKFQDSLKLVGTKHFSEMNFDASTPEGKANRALVQSEVFNRYAPPEYAKALESNEGLSRNDLTDFRESGLANGSDRMKEYYKKQMRNEDSRHYVDHKSNVNSEISELGKDAAHQNDMNDVELFSAQAAMNAPFTPQQQAAFDAAKTRVKARHKDISKHLGYMNAEDVAKLDQKVLENPSVVQALTPRMLQEIGKQTKENGKFDQAFLNGIADRIERDPNADDKSKAYLSKVRASNNKDSPFSSKYWA